MNNQKFKQFWIEIDTNEILDYEPNSFNNKWNKHVHVIEYSAYQDALLQAITAQNESQELMDKIKDLEQYIDVMNDSALKTEGDLRKQIKKILEAIEEHAFGGDIVNSSHLNDKLDKIMEREL